MTESGANVLIPLFHSPDYDLVAEYEQRLLRVQVKTSTSRQNGRWTVALCTRGGNRSWSGIVKRFSAERCDFLFVLVEGGRRWFIPAGAVESATAINLGGSKYAAYEVDSGDPAEASRLG